MITSPNGNRVPNDKVWHMPKLAQKAEAHARAPQTHPGLALHCIM
jgi:hypothetical protein